VSDKTGWEGRDQQLGACIGIVWTLSRALGPAKENICALESLKGDIVWSCWELKRKSQLVLETASSFRLILYWKRLMVALSDERSDNWTALATT
jgi:hypothetical protein